MTPRTLLAFAAGALLGSLVQAVYDARGEMARPARDLTSVVAETLGSVDDGGLKSGDSLAENRDRFRETVDRITEANKVAHQTLDELGVRLDKLEEFIAVVGHRISSRSSVADTPEGSGAGGSQTSPPAPASGVRS